MKRSFTLLLALALAGRSIAPGSVGADTVTEISIDWASDGRLPPVGDQGISTTCVAWAVRTVAAFHRDRHAGEAATRSGARASAGGFRLPPGLDMTPSVTFIYNASIRQFFEQKHLPNLEFEVWMRDEANRRNALTTTVQPVFDSLRDIGSPSEFTARFSSDWSVTPDANQLAGATALWPEWNGAVRTARTVSLEGNAVARRKEVNRELQFGPLVLLMTAYPDFVRCSTVGGDYSPLTHRTSDWVSHAVVIVGYDPSHLVPDDGKRKPAFRLMNSYGEEWGDHGFTWVSNDRLFGCSFGPPLAQEVWTCSPLVGKSMSGPTGPVDAPVGFLGGSGWEPDGPRGCDEVPTPALIETEPARGDTPGSDPRPPSYASTSRPNSLEFKQRVAGARVTVTAPLVPWVPALADTTIRYFVDGREASSIDRKETGYTFRFAGHDDPGTFGAIAESAPSAPDAELARPTGSVPIDRSTFDENKADASKAGKGELDEEKPCEPPSLRDPGFGRDPKYIGARVDRGVLEITDPEHPNLKGGRDVVICIEVYYPGDCDPRSVTSYTVRIPK